jgi:hypothetical protein
MPSMIPLALGIGSSLLGGIGGSGNQGGLSQQQNQQSQSNQNSTMTPNEPGYAQQFRQGAMGDINQAIAQAQTPVYGDAQKAGYLNSLNDLANASMTNLQQNMARSGALSSGRNAAGMSDILNNRNSQAAGFFSQIPFLNAQAKSQMLNPLLATQAGLAGHAPVGYNQTGQTNTTSQGNIQQQQQGPGFLQGFLGNLGGVMGAGAGGTGPLANNPFTGNAWYTPKSGNSNNFSIG